jgi:hypothetical protein
MNESPGDSREETRKMSEKMKKIFVILSIVFVTCVSLVSLGIAYSGGIRGLGLLGVWFFLTFGIVVVLAQVIPAGILFVSFVNTAFNSQKKSAMPMKVA